MELTPLYHGNFPREEIGKKIHNYSSFLLIIKKFLEKPAGLQMFGMTIVMVHHFMLGFWDVQDNQVGAILEIIST